MPFGFLAHAMLSIGAMLTELLDVGEPRTCEDSESILAGILSFSEEDPRGQTMRLDGLTDFAWDQVYAYGFATAYETVQEALGERYRMNDESESRWSSDSTVFVFANEGEIVCEVVVRPPVWITIWKFRGYGPDQAVLVNGSTDPTDPGDFRFRDDGPNHQR